MTPSTPPSGSAPVNETDPDVFDMSRLQFERPAEKIKTIDVPPIPERVFKGMEKYEDAARDYDLFGVEKSVSIPNATDQTTPHRIYIKHRPADAQVAQIYRLPLNDPEGQLERLTYFDIGSGRTLVSVKGIEGDDWHGDGYWRGGGVVLCMDVDGKENLQLWRLWEDGLSSTPLPPIKGEIDNKPSPWRMERLTHDNDRYFNVVISSSNRLMAVASTRHNGTDTLPYLLKLRQSVCASSLSESAASPAAGTELNALALPMRLLMMPPVTPPGQKRTVETWFPEDISVDDKRMVLAKQISNSYIEIYLIDLPILNEASSTIRDPVGEEGYPELKKLVLPGATEPPSSTYTVAQFSRNPDKQNLLYLSTDAYGDFRSVVTYDADTGTVTHITTPGPQWGALRSIPWGVFAPDVEKERILFTANVEGWRKLYVVPLKDSDKHPRVIEVKLEWEGGQIYYVSNAINGKPGQIIVDTDSYKQMKSIGLIELDLDGILERIQFGPTSSETEGDAFVTVPLKKYVNATLPEPAFRTVPPKLVRYKSFDGLEVPFLYYHPTAGDRKVPVVVQIHGGPEGQSGSTARIPIHGYLLNELQCAVVYPNVRGSSGYGKRYMDADSVEKREDSVKDIGALLEYIKSDMSDELDGDKIAVAGGSYGGYTVFASLTHFSPLLTCGLSNFGISHFPRFLEKTAPMRRQLRRMKYGDESDPKIREFLERISPLNPINAKRISVPLLICHGENDTRVPVEEGLRMWSMVKESGIVTEMVVCEMEGHGWKQKSVIEYTNAVRIRFLERFLFDLKEDGEQLEQGKL